MFFKSSLTRNPPLTALLMALALVFTPIRPSWASAPMAGKAAPGYRSIMLGDFQITALSDGTVKLPVDKLLMGTTPAHVDKVLAAHFESSPLETSVNAYLVNTGRQLILIDTGAGKLFGPTLGKLVDNLKASGYRPDQVDDILITHMHPDHEGGLSRDGKRVFPNATVWVNRKDADYWLDRARMKRAAKADQGFFKGAMVSFQPYIRAHRLRMFTGNARIVPGIQARPEPGHTPGHTGYLVQSDGHTLLVWGDIIHVQAVQFAQPRVTIHFDTAPAQARSTRLRLLSDAAARGYLVAGAHLAFPGLGHVRRSGKAYAWIPVNYTVPR